MTLPISARQTGVTLTGLIFVLMIVALIAIFGMKIVPSAIEYNSIRKGIVSAKAAGTTPKEIRVAFDRQAEVGYIESVKGKDLDIVKNGEDLDVSFAYQKKIPIFGPASLLLEYEGTTSKKPFLKGDQQ
ncbi:MAG: DUF4845 domain-containing protein [Herminiimonas sp.]|nr:DUF4845 domain-containing protein [Herminiimonas sp.]